MPVPAVVLFEELRGNTLPYVFTISGVNMTLQGTKAWFTGKISANDPDNQAIWSKTIANGGIVVNSSTQATATLLPADTASLADGTVVLAAFQVETPSGFVAEAVRMQITFTADIQRGT
jgi:hypothetical protein